MTNLLQVQKYLASFGYAKLTEDLAVKQSTNPDTGLVSLKYSQKDSPMGNPVVQECRGIILDPWDNHRVVARPFDKFFNHDEFHAAKLDPSTSRFYEKRDGSLIIGYEYKGKTYFGSSSIPVCHEDLANAIDLSDLDRSRFHAVATVNKDWTFLFELTGPSNRVIVAYDKYRMTLLAMRSRIDGSYASDETCSLLAEALGVSYVRAFPAVTSIHEALEMLRTLSPVEHEGFVVVDKNHNRVKIKHPGYVALHHRKSSPYAAVDIVKAGEISEVAASFPEMAGELSYVEGKMRQLTSELQGLFDRFSHLDRKEFCIAVQGAGHPFGAALIPVYLKKVDSVRSLVYSLDSRKLQHHFNKL